MADREYPHTLAPGTELHEYRITQVLGIGSFGITYLGEDVNLGKKVAIKEYMPNESAIRFEGNTVKPKSTRDEMDYTWGRDRFLDEARILAQFDHPNINRVYRYFEANNTAYIVLEYIEGQTLAELLDRGHVFTEQELTGLLAQLAGGLAVVHQAGYIHRDVKPANIIMRTDRIPVLVDFGAARQAVGAKTKSITTIITPGYAPTEQYDQTTDLLGPWSDIYALGMVMYRCISGKNDSEIADAVSRTLAINNKRADPLEPLKKFRGTFSKTFLDKIEWAISVNEKKRPQSIGAWIPEILDAKKIPKPAPDAGQPPPQKKTGGLGKVLAVFGALVVLVVVAGLVKVLVTGRPAPKPGPAAVKPKSPEPKIEFGKLVSGNGPAGGSKAKAARLASTGLHDRRKFRLHDQLVIHAQKGLSLRESPSLESRKLTSIWYGRTVEVLAQPLKDKPISVDGIRGHWVKVKYGVLTGYVFSGFLSGLPAVGDTGFEKYTKKLESVAARVRTDNDRYKYTGGCEWHQGHVIIGGITMLDAYLVSRKLFRLPAGLRFPVSARGYRSTLLEGYRYEFRLQRKAGKLTEITVLRYSGNDLEAKFSISRLNDDEFLLRHHPDKRGCNS